MPLFILDFFNFSVTDLLDIAVIAVMVFFILKWSRESTAQHIIIGIFILVVLRLLSKSMGMKMTASVFDTIFDVGMVAILVLFQPEMRRGLRKLGDRGRSGGWLLSGILLGKQQMEQMKRKHIFELTRACVSMSHSKTGALIVVTGRDKITEIEENGTPMDAIVTQQLVENIFFKNTPLHDGAMIVTGDRIVAAGCSLPNTKRQDLPSHYGMRHRAAVGMSEECDATILVVSEETGAITVFNDGKGNRIKREEELNNCLLEFFESLENKGGKSSEREQEGYGD